MSGSQQYIEGAGWCGKRTDDSDRNCRFHDCLGVTLQSDRCVIDGCSSYGCEHHQQGCDSCGRVVHICDRHAVHIDGMRMCPDCAGMAHFCEHGCGELAETLDDGVAVCWACLRSTEQVARAMAAIPGVAR